MTADERETLEALAGSQESDARLYAGQPHRAAECRSRAATIRASPASERAARAASGKYQSYLGARRQGRGLVGSRLRARRGGEERDGSKNRGKD